MKKTKTRTYARTHSLATVMMQSDITFNLEYLISFLFSPSASASLGVFHLVFRLTVLDLCLGRINELFASNVAEKIEMFGGGDDD